MNYVAVAPPEDGKFLRFLYRTVFGRIILKTVSARWISKICGAFMSSRLSKPLIRNFIKKNNIDMSEYLPEEYGCFNDFFVRRIRPELRPTDTDCDSLICPCDGLLSVYNIRDDLIMPIKQGAYSVKTLLGNCMDCSRFYGGIALVFRLCPYHYHRYCYFDDCEIIGGGFIDGKLHTVRPIALQNTSVFCENCREITLFRTGNFGVAAQIEVGAMLVGKISNLHSSGKHVRGEEKGMFLFGGSTIVVLLEKGTANIPDELFAAADKGLEVSVRAGEKIGKAIRYIL